MTHNNLSNIILKMKLDSNKPEIKFKTKKK